MSSSSPPKTARRIKANEQKRLVQYMKNRKTKSLGSGVADTLSSAFGRTEGDPKKREKFYRDLFSVDIITPLYCAFDPENLERYNRRPRNSQENHVYQLSELREKLHSGFNDSRLYAQIGCYIQDLVFREVTHGRPYLLNGGEEVSRALVDRMLPIFASTDKDESSDIYFDGIFSQNFSNFFLNENPLFVIHAGDRDSNIGLTNEAVVGLYALNELRDYFPTFQYIYAAFRAPAFVNGEAMRDRNYYSTYTLVETLEDCVPLGDWIDGGSDDFEKNLAHVLFQVFAAIGFANEKYGFSHNNLKMSNIFVRKIQEKTTLGFGEFRMKTQYITKIANFTQSRIARGEHGLATPTGKFDEANGYSPSRSNNLVDFLTLLTEICMYRKSIEVSSILGILPGSIKIKVSENTEVIFLLKLLTENNLNNFIKIMTGGVQKSAASNEMDMDMNSFLKLINPSDLSKQHVQKVTCHRNNYALNDTICTELEISLRPKDQTNEFEREYYREGFKKSLREGIENINKQHVDDIEALINTLEVMKDNEPNKTEHYNGLISGLLQSQMEGKMEDVGFFQDKVNAINADLNKIKKNEAQRSFTSYFWNSNRGSANRGDVRSADSEC
jgi:hypothetical protein